MDLVPTKLEELGLPVCDIGSVAISDWLLASSCSMRLFIVQNVITNHCHYFEYNCTCLCISLILFACFLFKAKICSLSSSSDIVNCSTTKQNHCSSIAKSKYLLMIYLVVTALVYRSLFD